MSTSKTILEGKSPSTYQDGRIERIVEYNSFHEDLIVDRSSISIVIPTYNSSHLLRKAFDAILSSDRLPLEVIIVDDFSKDVNIPRLLDSYPFTYVRLKKNFGPAVARNIGALVSKGNFILFIDDDIMLSKDSIQIIENTFSKNPDYKAIVGLLSYEHPNKDLISRYKNFYMFHSLSHSPEIFGCLYTSITAIRLSTFEYHKGFDESHKRASVEDVDLGQRLNNNGDIVFLDKSLMVVHYKKYSLKSFVKNEFIRSYDLLTMMLANRYIKKLATQKRYLNNSPITLISTVLCALLMFMLLCSIFFPMAIWVVIGLFCAITLLNIGFILNFNKYYPVLQTIMVPFMIVFDFSIASIGILYSLIRNFKKIY